MAQTRSYITPIDSTGAPVTPEAPHGQYTLASGSTFFYVLSQTNGAHQSFELTGLTAGLVITSATIQTTDHAANDVTDFDTTVGNWINEDPDDAKSFARFVAVDGTGWTVANSVVAASGAGVGGARWNLPMWAATRTRIAVVVGATGGAVRASAKATAP